MLVFLVFYITDNQVFILNNKKNFNFLERFKSCDSGTVLNYNKLFSIWLYLVRLTSAITSGNPSIANGNALIYNFIP